MSATRPADIAIKPGIFVGEDFRPGHARLRASRCLRCAETFFPARMGCPRCQASDMKDVVLGPTGRVNSATAVMRQPNHYAAPYWLAEVDVPEGVRLITQIESAVDRDIRIGEIVTLTTQPVLTLPDGRRLWSYIFEPAGEAAQ